MNPSGKIRWIVPLVAAIACVFLIQCGDDDDSGDNAGDEVIRSCANVDGEVIGPEWPIRTLSCDGWWGLGGDMVEWNPINGTQGPRMVIKSDAELERVLAEGIGVRDCDVDFETEMILAVWMTQTTTHMYSSVEICSANENGGTLYVPTVYNHGDGSDLFASSTYWHFVTVERTEMPVLFAACGYFGETDQNSPGCNLAYQDADQ